MASLSVRRLSFYVITLLLPFVLLALFELGLRAIGYGQTQPLFVDAPSSPGYMMPNPKLIERYFNHPSQAPDVSPDTVLFEKQKAEDTFRIVIQGGSSAAGFPYGRFGSLHGMLEQRFKLDYPDKQIEIINTAMSAVNSYTLLDLQSEILAIQPDLVLVYAGHNEYLGVLGAGSIFSGFGSRFATLTYLELKQLRLYQLMQQLIAGMKSEQSTNQDGERTLMAKVAKGKNIEIDSELYQLGLTQFEGNLTALLSGYQKANIPVLVGNLVSNEKDLPPFDSIGKSPSPVNQPLASDPKSITEAALAYAIATQYYQQSNFDQAARFYRRARDLDSLRFRAPSAFATIIERVAKVTNANLVDVEAHFRRHSAYGIVGEELLLEHVHPNANGYFLLADAFYLTMLESNVLPYEGSKTDSKVAYQHLPLTEFDLEWANIKIQSLINDYPFTDSAKPMPPIRVEGILRQLIIERSQGTDWLTLQHKLAAHYEANKQFDHLAKVLAMISDALVSDPELAKRTSQLYRQLNEMSLALYYQSRAVRLAPDNSGYLMDLAHLYFLMSQPEQALTYLNKALPLAQNPTRVQFFIDKVTAQLQSKAKQGQTP